MVSATCSSTSLLTTTSNVAPEAASDSAVVVAYSSFPASPGSCRACAVAAAMLSAPASMPSTFPPSRASGSARMPPPQPTSTTVRPARGRGTRAAPAPAPAPPAFSRTASTINGTRTAFMACKPANGPPMSFHHCDATAVNLASSPSSTVTVDEAAPLTHRAPPPALTTAAAAAAAGTSAAAPARAAAPRVTTAPPRRHTAAIAAAAMPTDTEAHTRVVGSVIANIWR